MSEPSATATVTGHLSIDGEFNIYTVADWRVRLLEVLAPGGDVHLDLSGVSEIDSAGLQLLIAAHNQAVAGGHRLALIPADGAVAEVLGFARLDAFFAASAGADVGVHP